MTTLPNADDVARAIVAACRETGEDPIKCATEEWHIRARHYAMHALLHTFPDLQRFAAARLVGCPGSAPGFWNKSWHQVAKPHHSGRSHSAKWWDEDAYGRVIAAIEQPRTNQKMALIEQLNLRRRIAPCVYDVTASLMGDPPHDRSALADRRSDPS